MASRSKRTQAVSGEQAMAELVDELMEKLQAGEPVDLDSLADPRRAAELRPLLPAMEMLVNLQRTTSGTAPALPRAADEDGVRVLGDYRIVREIGRGGMGVVYEAEQLSLGRRVALKVLPFASLLDERQILRFRNEAHAAAQLHHTNIVPIFSVGCERGVHYYAMQYIEGQTLETVIRELREFNRASTDGTPRATPASAAAISPDGSPSGGEFFRSVARLGVQAAEALEHAHNLGIVHRDIKPSNLLLDVRGNLWITDFGLARCRESDLALTMSGDIVGTLRYMSPEQALGRRNEIDQRSDIYSLGVTLYEFLTLEPAFAGRDREVLLRQIASEDPRAPRKVNRHVPPEIETIVLKAMAKEPDLRYGTAQELADDLRRYLEDRPIRARRPTLPQRLRKWSRRHRALVGAGAMLLVLATIGMAIASILIWRAEDKTRKALTKAEASAQDARDEADRAEKYKLAAIDAVEKMLTRVADEKLLNVPHMEPVRKALLEQALGFYQRFLEERSDDPKIMFETAKAYGRVGYISGLMGRPEEAVSAYRKAIELGEELVRGFGGQPTHRSELADSYDGLATELHKTTLGEEAYGAWDKAIAIYEGLARESPEDFHSKRVLVTTLIDKGRFLSIRGHKQDADDVVLRARDLATEALFQAKGDPDLEKALIGALTVLGDIYLQTSRPQQAETSLRQAMAFMDGLPDERKGTPDCRAQRGATLYVLSAVLLETGRAGEAKETLQKAFTVQSQLAGDFPTYVDYRRRLGMTSYTLGHILREEGAFPDAEAKLLESRAQWEKLAQDVPNVPEYRSKVGWANHALALLWMAAGKKEEMDAAFHKAAEIAGQLVKEFPRIPSYRDELARCHVNYGMVLKDRGERGRAEEEFRTAIELYDAVAKDLPDVSDILGTWASACGFLASLLEETGRPSEAEPQYRKAIGILTGLTAKLPEVPEFRLRLASFQSNRVRLLDASGRKEEAEASARAALETCEKIAAQFPGVPHHEFVLAGSLHRLGEFLQSAGRRAEARESLEKAIVHQRAAIAGSPEHAEYRAKLVRYSAEWIGFLVGGGEHAEAVRAAGDFLQLPNDDGESLYQVAANLAGCISIALKDEALSEEERAAAAKTCADQAMELLEASAAHGFADAERLANDPDLKPLHDRPEFQALLARMREHPPEAKTGAP